MEFSKRKVIDGLDGTDETQLGQQTEQMVRERRQEALRSLVRSLEVKGKERVVLDWEKDRLGAARIKQVPSDSSGAFHISGIQSTSSQDLVLSRPSHKPGGSVPPIQEGQRPP